MSPPGRRLPRLRLAALSLALTTLTASTHAPAVRAASATPDLRRLWRASVPAPPALPPPTAAPRGGKRVPTAVRRLLLAPVDVPPPATAPGLELGGPTLDRLAASLARTGAASATIGANVRINNPTGDATNTTNSETTIASRGLEVVAAWDDGLTASVSPGPLGYAYSLNGGATFTDGGGPPVAPVNARWVGNPVVVADDAARFTLVALYSTNGGSNSSIAAAAGAFGGSSFAWSAPVVVASAASGYFDSPSAAVDPETGQLYVAWTHVLGAGGGRIEWSTSTDHGATWSGPAMLTDAALETASCPRIAVGLSHEVQVIYLAYDLVGAVDVVRTRRSTDLGASFAAEVTLPAGPSGVILNQGSGPPGYNRQRGMSHPALAINRTCGPNTGRLVAAWDETFNYYADALGGAGAVTEGNNTTNNLASGATAFTVGQQIDGALSSGTDVDWFKFTGTAGQNVVFYLAPTGGSAEDGFLYLFAGGTLAGNRVAYSHLEAGTALCVYTLPSDGSYYLEVSHWAPGNGSYTLLTGQHVAVPGDEVARDVRDVVVQASSDGANWGARTIANDDAPRFDDGLPEVAINAAGQVWVDWFDHRNDPANGILADVRAARSSDGGASFLASQQVNDGASINWNLVSSNLVPNMGDYGTLFADGCTLLANFADGRKGSPDSWVAPINDNVAGLAATSLSQSSAASACGDTVRFTAVVCPVTATGTVQFQDGGVALGAGLPLDGVTGTVTLATTALAGGSHSITAVYGGGGCFAGDTSTPVTQTVSSGTSTVGLGADVSPASCGAKVNFTATVSPAGATGSVTFFDGAASLGTAALDGSGHATLSLTSLAVGTHSLTASYAGDPCHGANVSAPWSQVVDLASSSTTLAGGGPATCGGLVSLTATVTPSGATGTVTFTEGAATLGTATVDGAGHAALSLTTLAVGSHDVVASYGGGACTAASASSPFTQAVNAAPSATALESDSNPSTCGAKVNLTATVTPAGATGTVTFTEGETTLGVAPVDGNGHASLSLTTLAVGSHGVVASYGGDACFAGSASTPVTQVVNAAPSATTLETDVNPSTCGGKVSLSAHVTPPGATGTVTFTDGGTPVDSATVSGIGVATVSLTNLSEGPHLLAARFGGDACLAPSTSPDVAQQVEGAPTTTALASDLNPSTCGAKVNLTATVSAAASGTVTFSEGAVTLGVAPVDAGGHATLSLTELPSGSHDVVASFSGTGCQAPSVSTPLSQVVDSAATAIVLGSDANPAVCGARVNLTAVVIPAGATGNVTFRDGATSLGAATLDGAGHATVAVTTFATGAHALTAEFAGDACHASSVSPAVSQQVTAVATTVTLVSDHNPGSCGAGIVLTATVHPAGATGTVTFKEGTTVIGAGTVDSTGVATLAFTPSLGAHALTAVYGGDDCHAGITSSTLFELVTKGATAATLSSDVNASLYGQAVTLGATVTPAGVTGTVTFYDLATLLATVPVDGAGHATYVDSTLAIGSHPITATYSGDGCHTGSAADTLRQVVNGLPISVAWTSDPSPRRFGIALTLSVQVTPNLVDGAVSFLDGNTELGQRPVDAGGHASLEITTLAAGKHDLSAHCFGDGTHAGSTTSAYSQVILPDAAPSVAVTFPNGGETLKPDSTVTLTWSATDDDSVAGVSLYLSRDFGATWDSIATGVPNTGAYDWTVSGPGTNNDSTAVYSALFRVVARDGIGQLTSDASDAPFSIYDELTAVVVTRLDAEPLDDGIRIVWGLSNARVFASVTLERSEAEVGPWRAATADVERQGDLTVMTDHAVAAGHRYWYRLVGVTAGGARSVFGPVAGTAGAPRAFELSAAWPNPTRGALRVNFAVPRAAVVRLSVVDVQGREVVALVDGPYAPGRYQVAWDGVTDRGAVRPGLYFLRLQSTGARFVQRVVVTR